MGEQEEMEQEKMEQEKMEEEQMEEEQREEEQMEEEQMEEEQREEEQREEEQREEGKKTLETEGLVPRQSSPGQRTTTLATTLRQRSSARAELQYSSYHAASLVALFVSQNRRIDCAHFVTSIPNKNGSVCIMQCNNLGTNLNLDQRS